MARRISLTARLSVSGPCRKRLRERSTVQATTGVRWRSCDVSMYTLEQDRRLCATATRLQGGRRVRAHQLRPSTSSRVYLFDRAVSLVLHTCHASARSLRTR